MLCNLRNWIAKLVYLCNMVPEYCFQLSKHPFCFVLQNRTISFQLEKAIFPHIFKCLIGLKLIFGHKSIIKCDLFGIKIFVVIRRLLLVVSQQSSTTIPAATRNNASIPGDLLSGGKYKFPQSELGLEL